MQPQSLGKPCYRPKQSPGCICLTVVLQHVGYNEEAFNSHRLGSTQKIRQSSAMESTAGFGELVEDVTNNLRIQLTVLSRRPSSLNCRRIRELTSPCQDREQQTQSTHLKLLGALSIVGALTLCSIACALEVETDNFFKLLFVYQRIERSKHDLIKLGIPRS
jgi:hypothetical protein